ncbi:MAG: nucleoside recognition domain-containing protein [Candidatus Eisenbacteria bacterium]
MLNGIWIFLVVGSLVAAAFSGHVADVTTASVEWAKKAVTLAIGLVGMMAFWLGMMRVARDAGILTGLARGLRPVMTRLFPGIPAEHPAMSAMIMNISANMLGLANAATPFGIKAMEELDRLNPKKGTATNAMCLFLAINTSNVSILPLGVMAIRASAGSENVAAIVPTTILATTISTVTAIFVAKLFARTIGRKSDPGTLDPRTGRVADTGGEAANGTGAAGGADAELSYDDDETRVTQEEARVARESRTPAKRWFVRITLILVFAALTVGFVRNILDPSSLKSAADHAAEGGQTAAKTGVLDLIGDVTSAWILPLLMAVIALFGWLRGVRVYESLVAGAREGFDVAIRIIPYLVAILVAVGMFQASGALDLLIALVSPVTSPLGLPGEALPMALLRPLSGSGAFGIMAHAIETYGADSYVGNLVSTLQGSTETTFYVLAVYFGSVAIKNTRHALPACLIADAAGIAGAVLAVKLLL